MLYTKSYLESPVLNTRRWFNNLGLNYLLFSYTVKDSKVLNSWVKLRNHKMIYYDSYTAFLYTIAKYHSLHYKEVSLHIITFEGTCKYIYCTIL